LQLGYHPVAVVKYRNETAQNEKQYTKKIKRQYKITKNTKQTNKYKTKNEHTGIL